MLLRRDLEILRSSSPCCFATPKEERQSPVNARYLVLTYQSQLNAYCSTEYSGLIYVYRIHSLPTNHKQILHIDPSSPTKGRSTLDPLQISLGCRVESHLANMSRENGVQSPPSPYDFTETAQKIGKRKWSEGPEEAQSVNGAGERCSVSERSEGQLGALLLDVFEVMKRYAHLWSGTQRVTAGWK